MQGRLADRHGHILACTHFMPGWCVQHWGVVSGTGPAVTAGPMFLGGAVDSFDDGVRPVISFNKLIRGII